MKSSKKGSVQSSHFGGMAFRNHGFSITVSRLILSFVYRPSRPAISIPKSTKITTYYIVVIGWYILELHYFRQKQSERFLNVKNKTEYIKYITNFDIIIFNNFFICNRDDNGNLAIIVIYWWKCKLTVREFSRGGIVPFYYVCMVVKWKLSRYHVI